MSDTLDLIFLRVAPRDIALLKFVFESHEGVAIIRTVDRHTAIIVVMASHDFLAVAREILDSVRETIPCEEIPPPEGEVDWLLQLVEPYDH